MDAIGQADEFLLAVRCRSDGEPCLDTLDEVERVHTEHGNCERVNLWGLGINLHFCRFECGRPPNCDRARERRGMFASAETQAAWQISNLARGRDGAVE